MENKYLTFNGICLITFIILSATIFVSCSNDDEKENVPFEYNELVKQMLDSTEATDITCVSAVLTGTWEVDGDWPHHYKGKDVYVYLRFVAEEDYKPEMEGDTFPIMRNINVWDHKSFYFYLDWLKPATTYLYKTYLTVDGVTYSGEVHSFTTVSADEYLWMDVTERYFQSVKLAGKCKIEDALSGNNISLYYSLVTPPNAWKFHIVPTINGDNMTATIDGLLPGVNYEFWMKAAGGKGAIETNKQIFRTASPADYIYVNEPSQITPTSAVISLSLDPKLFEDNDNSTVIIKYGTNKNKFDHLVNAIKINEYGYTMTLTGLTPATTYYFCVGILWYLGNNLADWYYTDIHSFTTDRQK